MQVHNNQLYIIKQNINQEDIDYLISKRKYQSIF